MNKSLIVILFSLALPVSANFPSQFPDSDEILELLFLEQSQYMISFARRSRIDFYSNQCRRHIFEKHNLKVCFDQIESSTQLKSQLMFQGQGHAPFLLSLERQCQEIELVEWEDMQLFKFPTVKGCSFFKLASNFYYLDFISRGNSQKRLTSIDFSNASANLKFQLIEKDNGVLKTRIYQLQGDNILSHWKRLTITFHQPTQRLRFFISGVGGEVSALHFQKTFQLTFNYILLTVGTHLKNALIKERGFPDL